MTFSRIDFKQLIKICILLCVLLVIYQLCRTLFFFFNQTHFSELGVSGFLRLCFYGILFDTSAIMLLNAPVFLLDLLPFPFRERSGYRKASLALFCLINSLGILANCVDMAYFKFILKRSTFDVFSYLKQGDDVYAQLPQYIADFWYIGLLWLALTLLLVYVLVKTGEKKAIRSSVSPAFSASYFFRHSFILVISFALFILLYRGGFQLKPISIISAGKYTSVKNIPLVINTPFSILKTIDLEQIKEKHYFSDTELEKYFNPVQAEVKSGFRKMNVVLIILESFSKEYIGCLNGDSITYTPFLDSLAQQGLLFTNAYANGKKSIEALPAIVAGIPTLMNEPYLTSIYGSNRIQSLPSILKEKGYNTSFFHGGTNGTMGFDAFARLSGFEKYYGRNEYNNEKDFDGTWGIWDEEFFQYFAGNLREMKQPFFSTFFSLSSHHPFAVPGKYSSTFKEEKLPIHKSIRYTDYALRKFMKTAATQPWYNNTLFVFTADHTGTAGSSFYDASIGAYQVPVLFYTSGKNASTKNNTLISHCDLPPTLLRYLGYEGRLFSFGTNALDSIAPHFNINFFSNTYQFIENDFVMHFDGEQVLGFYQVKNDPILQINLSGNKEYVEIELKMLKKLKALIQTYNHSLIHNKMTP